MVNNNSLYPYGIFKVITPQGQKKFELVTLPLGFHFVVTGMDVLPLRFRLFVDFVEPFGVRPEVERQ